VIAKILLINFIFKPELEKNYILISYFYFSFALKICYLTCILKKIFLIKVSYKNEMNKVLKAAVVIIVFSLFLGSSCNKDKVPEKKENAGDSKNSDLVKQDEKGTKVNIKIQPKAGDIFKYKMVKASSETNISPLTDNKEMVNAQSETYYFTQEVAEINESGVITYKMRYDSIIVTSKVSLGDSSKTLTYNSNIKDTVSSMTEFIVYNNITNSNFKIRVSASGELYDVYELESIYDKVIKTLGDTLASREKEGVKENIHSSMKDVISGQFQEFPKTEIYKDSVWSLTKTSDSPPFPFKNIITYKVKEIAKEGNDNFVTIEAVLAVEFINKENKTKEGTMKIENSDAGGKGTTKFNLSRGTLSKKETIQNINIDLLISTQGRKFKTKKKSSLSLNLDLLN
jgi:hypothetical protein